MFGFGVAGFVDLRDTRMLQPAERLCLLLKSAQEFVRNESRLDNLQCDGSTGLLLLGFVHRSHSALRNQTANAVAPDRGRKQSRPRGGKTAQWHGVAADVWTGCSNCCVVVAHSIAW